MEGKPLLEIIDNVFWYSFLMNFIKISEYSNFHIIWFKNSANFIICFFLIYIGSIIRVNIFGVTMIYNFAYGEKI